MLADWTPAIAADSNDVYYSYCASGDANDVYFIVGQAVGTVNEMPLVGGAVKVLASGQGTPVGPVVDADNVYWATTKSTPAMCGLCTPPPPVGQDAIFGIAK